MPEPRAVVTEKGIRPGFNGTGVTLLKNRAVVLTVAGADDPPEIEFPTDGGGIYGIVFSGGVRVDIETDEFGIPDQTIGDVQIDGVAVMATAEDIPVGTEVSSNAVGEAQVAASGHRVIGVALIPSTFADDPFTEVELAGIGQGRIIP